MTVEQLEHEDEDDEGAAGDAAALLVLDRLVARAADGGLLRAEELAECLEAVERFRGLIIDWHGDDAVDLPSAGPAGAG